LVADSFKLVVQELARQVIKRNKSLPPTKAVEITTMTGCSAVN